jgi:hypothetical protein
MRNITRGTFRLSVVAAALGAVYGAYQSSQIAEDKVLRKMGLRRAVFLLIASLLLWCGSMLLVLDLANASGNQGQVALIGLFLVAIGGGWLGGDFFEVTAWLAREASQRLDFNQVEVLVERPKNHAGASGNPQPRLSGQVVQGGAKLGDAESL